MLSIAGEAAAAEARAEAAALLRARGAAAVEPVARTTGADPAELILAEARAWEAGRVAMGAYGQCRRREVLFGPRTRTLPHRSGDITRRLAGAPKAEHPDAPRGTFDERNTTMPESPAHPTGRNGPCKQILFATDLTCRCDRAQDRAISLAEQWSAKLHVLHVLEGQEPEDLPSWRRGHSAQAKLAERQIQADLEGRPVDHAVILERGDPAKVILRKAVELDCGLIVTGMARNGPLGPSRLGDAVEWLVRRAPVPVLVVKDRPRRPYAEIVVATDCSEPSRHALECALRLFPEARMTLFHAWHVPFEGLLGSVPNQEECRAAAAAECAAFMARVQGPGDAVGRMHTLIEYGSADELLGAYVRDMPVDLVVLGTHGRSGLAGFLVGSTAARLLSLLPCDVLMVRGPAQQPKAREEG